MRVSPNTRATIMVIDDSPTVLRVVDAVLSQAGFAVVCLEGGTDAVAVAQRAKPDLIFVDFAMPDMSGYAVCQALGLKPDLESIPIVLMNTRGDPVGDVAGQRGGLPSVHSGYTR